MGTMVFQWQGTHYQLLVLQNRDDWHSGVFKVGVWWDEDKETKDILGRRDEKSGGTWFGCSKQGRVAFLSSLTPFCKDGAELFPARFLKGKMTPREFAEELDKNENLSSGLSYNLIVADIPSNSMFYIFKKSPYNKVVDYFEEVGPGIHTISEIGLDDRTRPKSKYLKDDFTKVVTEYENKELPIKVIAAISIRDDQVISEGQGDSHGKRECYRNGRPSTTAMMVKHTGKVSFYDKYLQNGESKKNVISFCIN